MRIDNDTLPHKLCYTDIILLSDIKITMKHLLKKTITLAALLSATNSAHAQVSLGFPGQFADFSSQDLKATIENIIRIILGFLGILVIVAIIYGGFRMMTAGGNADQNEGGRKIIIAGAIGLVVILAAYAIASFVVNSLQSAV